MNRLGKAGEEIALSYLIEKGYRVLQKNYRTVFGEIDIIAKVSDTIVFIEVKTRTDSAFGHPFEAVDKKKREKIRKVALCYLKKLKEEKPARFDILSIYAQNNTTRVEHMIDAFEV